MELKNKEVLMVLSHCDDEIICGWPIFQDDSIKKKIIIVSSDLNNKDRIWCSHRKFIFYKICKQFNIENWCLDYNSEFCMNSISKKSLEKNLISLIKKIKFNYIFTHNFYGEYGHPDHIFLFNLIQKYYFNKTIISDICYKNIKKRFQNNNLETFELLKLKYFTNRISTAQLNEKLYLNIRNFYKEFNVWTWTDHIGQKKTSLYLT